MKQRKIVFKRIKKCIAVLMVFVMSGLNGVISFAQEDFSDFGILEYIDEDGSVVRKYDSTKRVTYSRNRSDNSWVREMLLTMGMRAEAVENLSDEDVEKYAGEGSMQSIGTYYKFDGEGNASIVPVETVNQARTPGQNFVGEYEDDYIYVFHSAWVSEDGNTIINTTIASWLNMPTYRYTDSIGSLTQLSAIRYATVEGYYSYNKLLNNGATKEAVKVEFEGANENGVFTPETDFQSLQDGTLSGIGVTFPLPDKQVDEYGNVIGDGEDFYVYLTYEASPINLSSGEEINVYASYCHTVLRFGWDASLSINGDFSITPNFALGKHIKPVYLTITL